MQNLTFRTFLRLSAWAIFGTLAVLLLPEVEAQNTEYFFEPLQRVYNDQANIQGIEAVSDAAFSSDGLFLITASPVEPALAVFEIDPEEGVLRQTALWVDSSPIRNHYRSIELSSDDRFLFARGYRGDRPEVFRFDPSTGELDLAEKVTRFGNPDEAWVLAPDSRNLYAWRPTGSLNIYGFDAESAHVEKLQEVEVLSLPDGSLLSLFTLRIGDVAMSSDGRHLYVAHQDGILVLDRDPIGGWLTYESEVPLAAGGPYPEGIVDLELSPDGSHLYVFIGDEPQRIVVFDRDEATGALGLKEEMALPPAVPEFPEHSWDASFSQDGLHFFISRLPLSGSRPDGAGTLTISVRNPRTGGLARLEQFDLFSQGLEGFVAPGAIAPSRQGDIWAVSVTGGLQLFKKAEIPCPAEEAGLCLGGERFAVEVDWRRPNGTEGTGTALDLRSDDSGLFWFFREDNLEMLVKVLDGCSRNDSHWVFSAATTNVEYDLKVADRLTGLRRTYSNEQGVSAPALTDTGAFAACLSTAPTTGDLPAPVKSPARPGARSSAPLSRHRALAGTCVPDDVTLCLNGGRFKVEVAWERSNGTTGVGHEVPFGADDSGLLWFFQQANWEMLVKILDGCANNGHYWVFSAATTNVEYTLRVTDTVSGQIREYFNPLGNRAAAITDTFAFETCS